MDEKQSRVRWDDQELSRLAAAMAPRLLADPALHPLDAARAAQEVLEPHRRRELKAWAMVEARLQPRLDAALARLQTQPSLPELAEPAAPAGDAAAVAAKADVPGAAEPGDVMPQEAGAAQDAEAIAPARAATSDDAGGAVTAAGVDGGPAPSAAPAAVPEPGPMPDLFGEPAAPCDTARPALVSEAAGAELVETVAGAAPGGVPDPAAGPAAGATALPRRGESRPATVPVALDPLRVEAALVAALQSPALEAVLVDLFTRTLAQAVARVGAQPGPSAAAPAHKPSGGHQRVLLAGFPESQQKALSDALSGSFEVRSWRPTQGPQLFETLARLCGLVVVPEDADEGVDADLKDLDVRVVRHAGQASRLVERIEELA